MLVSACSCCYLIHAVSVNISHCRCRRPLVSKVFIRLYLKFVVFSIAFKYFYYTCFVFFAFVFVFVFITLFTFFTFFAFFVFLPFFTFFIFFTFLFYSESYLVYPVIIEVSCGYLRRVFVYAFGPDFPYLFEFVLRFEVYLKGPYIILVGYYEFLPAVSVYVSKGYPEFLIFILGIQPLTLCKFSIIVPVELYLPLLICIVGIIFGIIIRVVLYANNYLCLSVIVYVCYCYHRPCISFRQLQ